MRSQYWPSLIGDIFRMRQKGFCLVFQYWPCLKGAIFRTRQIDFFCVLGTDPVWKVPTLLQPCCTAHKTHSCLENSMFSVIRNVIRMQATLEIQHKVIKVIEKEFKQGLNIFPQYFPKEKTKQKKQKKYHWNSQPILGALAWICYFNQLMPAEPV